MPDVSTLYIKVNSKEVKVGTVSLAALGKTAGVTATKVDKVTKASKQLAGRQKVTASELSSSFKVIGRDLSRYVTLPFLAASAASLKFSKDLTTGLGQVETLISGTGSRIYELQDLITSISSETGVGFENLNRGLYETISAFQDGADTAGRFETAVKASVAGSATVLDSVTLLSAVTKAYGDTSTEAAEKVADLAFAAVKYGQTTFKALATAIQGVTANANRLGVSQEELFSVYSTLTGVTGDAANVTTQFNRALLSLSNPTEDLKALFSEYRTEQGEVVKTGKEFIEVTGGAVQAFKEIYDSAQRTGKPLEKYITRQTGVIAVTALANQQFDTFNKKSSLVADSVGAMEEAFYASTTGIDEFQRILLQVKQTLATTGVEIGQILLPVIVVIAKNIAEASQRFTELDENAQKTIISIFGIVAALGPLLIMIGSILRVVKLFGSLKLLSSAGALGALNPVVLLGVAAAILVVSIAMGKWIKKVKLQVQALKDLREASMGFNDANTEFMDLIANTSDMSDVAERNNKIITELSKTYGKEFAGSLDASSASLNDIYQEMLKIEAFNFQKTLGAQTEQFDNLQKEIEKTADDLVQSTDKIKARFPDLFAEYGYSLDKAVDDWNSRSGLFSIDNVLGSDNQDAALAKMQSMVAVSLGYLDIQKKIGEQGDSITNFLDELQKDVEARTGNMLTLQRVFDKWSGEEITKELVIIPKGQLQDTMGLDGVDGLLGNVESTLGKRLKTWADYFAEITSIAGEAFANIEYDANGNAIGFIKGDGKLAANAYAKAFADELETQTIVSEALGLVFSSGNKADVLEKQLDKTFTDLMDLLSEKVNQLNTEGLNFSIADLLSGDDTSVEKMIEVFGIADSSIKGMIANAQELKEAFSTNTLLQSIDDIRDAYKEMGAELDKNLMGSNIFNIDRINDAIADVAQDNIDSLTKTIEKLELLGVDVSSLQFIRDEELQKLQDASNTLSAMQSELSNASSLANVFGTTMYEAWKKSGEGSEVFNLQLAAGLTVVEGIFTAIGAGLADMASGFGEVAGQMAAGADVAKQWDDVMGNFALSIAETISQLAIQVGMQLIGAGAARIAMSDLSGWALIGMGSGFLAGGLAGTFSTSAVSGYIAEKEQNESGGVYSGNQKLTKYAHGGVLGNYVNSIVDKPTYFANGTAVMGEAGAEAIMPLTRDSNGDLAVSAVGGGGGNAPSVSININNYASDSTNTSVTQNTDGSFDVNIIKKLVSSTIAGGGADKAMNSRFGTKVKGIN